MKKTIYSPKGFSLIIGDKTYPGFSPEEFISVFKSNTPDPGRDAIECEIIRIRKAYNKNRYTIYTKCFPNASHIETIDIQLTAEATKRYKLRVGLRITVSNKKP